MVRSSDKAPLHVTVRILGGYLYRVGHQGKGAQDVGELGLGEAVEVSDEAVEFSADLLRFAASVTPCL